MKRDSLVEREREHMICMLKYFAVVLIRLIATAESQLDGNTVSLTATLQVLTFMEFAV